MKQSRPVMSEEEIYMLIRQNFLFAHSSYSESIIYRVDKNTHVAELFEPSKTDKLFHWAKVNVAMTPDPASGLNYVAPSQSKIISAFSFCMYEAYQTEITPAVRSYRSDEGVWVDLGRNDGTALHISAGHVEIGEVPDGVVWLREESCAPIKVTEDMLGSSSKNLLKDCMRLWGQDADVVSQLLSAAVHRILYPSKPTVQQPIILIEGPAGSGKTVLSLMYQDLLDPQKFRGEVEAGSLDLDSVKMHASSTSVLVLGNASSISRELSDFLCVTSTGGSKEAREFYSQTNIKKWYMTSQIVLTGISFGRLKEDFITRLIHVTLSPRTGEITTEQSLWRSWDSMLPSLRSALWHLCAEVLQSEQDNRITLAGRKGRLLDFATTMRRVDRILGTHAESTWRDTLDNDQQLQQSDDPIVMAIIDRWDSIRDRTLTCEELFDLLTPAFDRINAGDAGTQRQAPRSPRSLAQNMNRIMPALQALRIKIAQNKDAHRKVKTWRLSLPEGVTLPDSPIRQSIRKSPFFGMDPAA